MMTSCVNPPGEGPQGVAKANLCQRLMTYVIPLKVGQVFGSVGYELPQLPRTVRAPDASFVRADRFPPNGIGPGLFKFAPDVAIEVLSPSDTASEMFEMIDDYLVAGTSLVWVVDPVRRTVMIVSRNHPLALLHEGDTLNGGEVLPEFSCDVSDIFYRIARDLR